MLKMQQNSQTNTSEKTNVFFGLTQGLKRVYKICGGGKL